MKYWEIIADNLHKTGWSLGWFSAIDVQGRTIWIVDAHDSISGIGTGDSSVCGEFIVVIAVWYNKDHDKPVTTVRKMGEKQGKNTIKRLTESAFVYQNTVV